MEILLIVFSVGVAGYFLSSIKERLESIDSSFHRLDDIRTDIGYAVRKLNDIKEAVEEKGGEINKVIEDVGGKVSDIDSSVREHIVGELEDIKEAVEEKGREVIKAIENVEEKIYDIEGSVDVIKDEMKSNES